MGTSGISMLNGLEQKDNKNILFVTYEDMSEDLGREVKNIAEFLGILLSKEKLNSIVNGSSFNLMRDNAHTNYTWLTGIDRNFSFMRKGEVGDWKNYLSAEHSKEIDRRVNERLVPLGAKIRYYLN